MGTHGQQALSLADNDDLQVGMEIKFMIGEAIAQHLVFDDSCKALEVPHTTIFELAFAELRLVHKDHCSGCELQPARVQIFGL